MVAETPIWRDRLTADGTGAARPRRGHHLADAPRHPRGRRWNSGRRHRGRLPRGRPRLGSAHRGGPAGLGRHRRGGGPAHAGDPRVERPRALRRPGPERAWSCGASWSRLGPDGVGLIELDWIGLAPDPDGFAPHQRPAVEWLDHDRVAELVPGLARPMAGALIRRQARVNPLRSLARLAAVLPAVATGTAATSVTTEGGRVTKVTTTAGDIYPGAVVFATGLPPLLDGLPAGPARQPGQGAPAGHRAVTGAAAGHGRAGRHPARGRPAAGRRHVRHGRRDARGPAGRHRLHPGGAVRHPAHRARAGRRLPVVLLPAAAPRRPAR